MSGGDGRGDGHGVAGALFGLAVAGLGLAPAAAWASTPRELMLAAGWPAGGAGAPLTRAELDALIARYPDRPAAGQTSPSSRTAVGPIRDREGRPAPSRRPDPGSPLRFGRDDGEG